MKEVNRLEYLSGIDDRFLTESWAECSSRKKKAYFPLKAAAVVLVILLAMGTAVYAAQKLGIFVSEKHSGDSGSGYTVKWDKQQVDFNELHGQLDSMKETIIEQNKNMDFAYTDEMPGYCQKAFDSDKKAVDFIGYDKLVTADWNYKSSEITVSLYASVRGERDVTMDQVMLEHKYEIDHIRLQQWEEIFFKGSNLDAGQTGVSEDGNVEYQQTKLKSADGDEWLVVDSSSRTGKYMFYKKNAYLTRDGVTYSLYMVAQDDGEDEARTAKLQKRQETLMKEWVDAYHF